MNNKKLKQIKLIDHEMKFVDVDLETMIESDIFELIRTNRLTKQDFAAWVEHQRDEWFHYGIHIGQPQS